MTKGAYAAYKGRTPGTVSHWIADGKISAAAMVGEGHHARIWVEQADADLLRSLDPAQQAAQENPIGVAAVALPNGVATLPQSAAAPGAPARGLSPSVDKSAAPTDDEMLRRRRKADAEKAEHDAEAARRKLAIDEGRWVDAAEALRTWTAKLAAIISETETYLTNTLARELADEFRSDAKTLAARIRDRYREFRSRVADDAANAQAADRARVPDLHVESDESEPVT
jgi:hypothetical protein